MRYAGIIPNDIAGGPGVCVSFFVQGCAQHCYNCHNPETWDFDGGKEFSQTVLDHLIELLDKNNIHRDLNIMGGEPLCGENLFLTNLVITTIKSKRPDTKIYLWTGYIYEDLLNSTNPQMKNILSNIDILVDGPYIDTQRDITLSMRGSKNQRIIHLKKEES